MFEKISNYFRFINVINSGIAKIIILNNLFLYRNCIKSSIVEILFILTPGQQTIISNINSKINDVKCGEIRLKRKRRPSSKYI